MIRGGNPYLAVLHPGSSEVPAELTALWQQSREAAQPRDGHDDALFSRLATCRAPEQDHAASLLLPSPLRQMLRARCLRQFILFFFLLLKYFSLLLTCGEITLLPNAARRILRR